MEQISKNYGDREMMDDMLSSQKVMASSYNHAALDCAHNSLKNELMTILGEEHQIGMELFVEMQARGWLTVEDADKEKIKKIKERFTGTNS